MATPNPIPTEEQILRSKMRALGEGTRVWVLEPGFRYICPSSTKTDTCYEVMVHGPEEITCSCPSGLHRGFCKHAGAVLVRLEVEGQLAHLQNTHVNGSSPNAELEDKIADLYR